MKFGKNLLRVVELSNPEWGPYWINYKYLKKLINEILEADGILPKPVSNTSAPSLPPHTTNRPPSEIAKSSREVQFFSLLRRELKKSSEFFRKAELEYKIRWERIWDAYLMLKDSTMMIIYDKNTWARLLSACVKFYKDVLLLENFAIMNYCGFSKILKKHDKLTGFVTREAFMKNVVNQQNITNYPDVLELIKKSEQLFRSIQVMETVVPLQAEEKLFIEAIIGLNYQASRMQAEEQQDTIHLPSDTTATTTNTTPHTVVTTTTPQRKDIANKTATKVMQTLSINTEAAELERRSIEIGEKLDDATNILVNAAAKLQHDSDMSPNLNKILTWMDLVKANNNNNNNDNNSNQQQENYNHNNQEKDVDTDQEEGDTLIVSKNLMKLNKRKINAIVSNEEDDDDEEDEDRGGHHRLKEAKIEV